MFAKLFRSHRSNPVNLPKADLSSLDDGLANLRDTAAEVTRAATSAARLLEDEHKRTKACFIALNSASDSICILDTHGCIYFCNDQFMDTNNITHYEEVVGEHILKVLPNISNFEAIWQSCQQNHTETILCPDTKSTLTIVPMMNGAPQPIYYICTFKADGKYR